MIFTNFSTGTGHGVLDVIFPSIFLFLKYHTKNVYKKYTQNYHFTIEGRKSVKGPRESN